MALPKLMHPVFELIIPSTKQNCKFRPFLVKEEKLLLMAKQGGIQADITGTLKQIINNCDVDSVLDVNTLSSFDVEYIFLKLRAKSINNIIELAYTDYEDSEVYKFEIDADEIEVIHDPVHTNIIKLSETSGIVMKYPNMELMAKVVSDMDIADLLFFMISGCVDQYYDGDNITYFKDVSQDEITSFVDNLPTKVISEFENFFNTMPKIYHKLEYTNKNGTERVIELKTLEDFFMLR